MHPTGRGSTPPPPPPIREYIPPPPAQIPVAQRTQGSISAEQAAQDERNRAANNAASGQPAQRGFTTPQHSGGINDPWQGGHDPWRGTNPGQYHQPNWHSPHSSHTRAAGGNTRDLRTTYPPPQQTPQQVQQQQEQRTRIAGNHSFAPGAFSQGGPANAWSPGQYSGGPQPMSAVAAAEHADNISTAQEGGTCRGN